MPGLLFDSHTVNFSHHNAPLAEHYPSFTLEDAIAVALQKLSGVNFLPSNSDGDGTDCRNFTPETEFFACDDFRMYEFKVRRCMRGRSHDWTECPFAHPGEKARRRDPRRVHYSASPCPDFRKGNCRRGDSCEFAHGVFECWLHPARYRTQACKDGKNCMRRVCFFAHSPEQLRLLPVSMVDSPAHTVSMVDSPGSPSHEVSMVGLPAHAVSMVGSPAHAVSMVGLPSQKTSKVGSPFTSMVSSLSQTTSMVGCPSRMSPITLHSSSFNGSPLRQAIAHSFLTSEGYVGGGAPLSPATASSAEYFSESDGYGRSAGAFLFGNDEVEEPAKLGFSKLNLPLGSLGKSTHELSSHSYGYGHGYGFPSPTSTLARQSYSPPPLSPPLSPLNSPNSDQINGIFTPPAHGLHNMHVDDAIPNREMSDLIFIHNTDHMEDLGFTAQDLQSTHSFNHAQPSPSPQNPHLKYGKVDSTRRWLHLGSPTLPHVSHSLPCTPRQSGWSPLCDLWGSNGYGLNIPPCEVEPGRDLRVKLYGRIGEESPMDNLMPDVGWVSELVK